MALTKPPTSATPSLDQPSSPQPSVPQPFEFPHRTSPPTCRKTTLSVPEDKAVVAEACVKYNPSSKALTATLTVTHAPAAPLIVTFSDIPDAQYLLPGPGSLTIRYTAESPRPVYWFLIRENVNAVPWPVRANLELEWSNPPWH